MPFKLGITVDFYMHETYNYALSRFDDHDLDARSQWLGTVKKKKNKKAFNDLDC